jgi:HPt (histidine-containing phosphotransfer) domain-containing protein
MAELDVRLAQVWAENRGEIDGRVDTIDAAVAALAAGGLDDDARRTAARAAHRLAGTAGTFGFTAASEHAAALDRALRAPSGDDEAIELARLAGALRVALRPRDEPGAGDRALPGA